MSTSSSEGRLFAPEVPYDGRLIFTSILTLNLGVETCFHDGMDSLERVWWQLAFPLYLFILMIITTLIARCFKWKRGAGFSTIQAFATLFLICYVSVLESCAELIAAIDIETLSGERLRRWVIDPTVEYFRGAHGLLAFSACVLFIFYIIPLPIFLLFPAALYRIRWFRNYKPVYDAIWNPFEKKYRFWLGFRLIFRWVPFLLVVFLEPPLNLFITSILVALLLFIQTQLRPFKGIWRNVLDNYFLLNIVILFLGSLYFRVEAEDGSDRQREDALRRLTSFSTTMVFFGYVAFAIVYCYHLGLRFPRLKECFKKCCRRKADYEPEKVFVPQTEAPDHVHNEGQISSGYVMVNHSGKNGTQVTSKESNARTVNFTELREPLLEDAGSIEIITVPATLK